MRQPKDVILAIQNSDGDWVVFTHSHDASMADLIKSFRAALDWMTFFRDDIDDLVPDPNGSNLPKLDRVWLEQYINAVRHGGVRPLLLGLEELGFDVSEYPIFDDVSEEGIDWAEKELSTLQPPTEGTDQEVDDD